MRVILFAALLVGLTACGGRYCRNDSSGVERSPWSAAPDAHKGPGSR